MLAHIRKKIAEVFVFVDFHLYCTEPDTPHGGLFVRRRLEGGDLFVRRWLEGGGLFEGGCLIESLQYIFDKVNAYV